MPSIRPAIHLLAFLLIHPSLSESDLPEQLTDDRPPDFKPQGHSPHPVGDLLPVGGLSATLSHTRSVSRPSPSLIPQTIDWLPSANFTTLNDSFIRQLPKLSPSSLAPSGALPSPPPLPYQQVLQVHLNQPIQDPLSTGCDSDPSAPCLHHKRSFAVHPRDNGPSPTWPGTDTVYATKTVFISQAAPATTVYVSNGQIITSFSPANSSPTPYVINSNNNDNHNGVLVSPSGNPNIVVATVTAISSAHRLVWDEFYSTHAGWWAMMVVMNMVICFFTFLGFGFVSFSW